MFNVIPTFSFSSARWSMCSSRVFVHAFGSCSMFNVDPLCFPIPSRPCFSILFWLPHFYITANLFNYYKVIIYHFSLLKSRNRRLDVNIWQPNKMSLELNELDLFKDFDEKYYFSTLNRSVWRLNVDWTNLLNQSAYCLIGAYRIFQNHLFSSLFSSCKFLHQLLL